MEHFDFGTLEPPARTLSEVLDETAAVVEPDALDDPYWARLQERVTELGLRSATNPYRHVRSYRSTRRP
jgi:hypothetical protein